MVNVCGVRFPDRHVSFSVLSTRTRGAWFVRIVRHKGQKSGATGNAAMVYDQFHEPQVQLLYDPRHKENGYHNFDISHMRWSVKIAA